VPERKDVRMKVDATRAPAGIVRDLAELLRRFPGDAPVFLLMEMTAGAKELEFGAGYRVTPDSDFYAEVRTLLGQGAVA
jgi:hypothetical protein